MYMNVLLSVKLCRKLSLILNWSLEVFLATVLPLTPLKQTDLSSCVSAKKCMNLMLSIYAQECQTSAKYLGVDGESEPVVPQVVARGSCYRAAW